MVGPLIIIPSLPSPAAHPTTPQPWISVTDPFFAQRVPDLIGYPPWKNSRFSPSLCGEKQFVTLLPVGGVRLTFGKDMERPAHGRGPIDN
jgi:hypothetical protein